MQFGLWRRPRVVAGRVYVIKGLGVIRVTAVEKIDLSRLTPWEAQAAGAKDVAELREWLGADTGTPGATPGTGYRVRFRYLGSETREGPGGEGSEEGPVKAEKAEEGGAPSPVKATPIPADLMEWVDKRDWRLVHLRTLADGIWRNADDISREVSVDSATTRRRMGDLRKRGLVTSHRHHGYRITPEGQGALVRLVDNSEGGAGSSASDWLKSKGGRSDIIDVIKDGKWHNAAEVGELLGLSVVSVQRRVAALRDRGLIESHRRRGYRLTEVGFEASGLEQPEPVGGEVAVEGPAPEGPSFAGPDDAEREERAPKDAIADAEPIPGDLLEWLDSKPYRKELMMCLPPDDYVSTSDLSELLSASVTALHGRLKTMKDRGLVESLPRHGYKSTELGSRVAKLLHAMAIKQRDEPAGAEAFLRAEPLGWVGGATVGTVPTSTAPMPTLRRPRGRWGATEACGFCRANAKSTPVAGWVGAMQTHLESSEGTNGKAENIMCHRGVIEDASWFLVVDRDPLSEGHCKLICKDHVSDLMELAEWANRDQRAAMARDTLSRDLLLSIEVISSLDPRIVEVMVLSGQDYGSHLHFDLIPRYRMDLPGLRPLASAKAHYDDLSLVRKRRLWKGRIAHLEEVADKLRNAARRILATRGSMEMSITERP